jgi:hypothetical protein
MGVTLMAKLGNFEAPAAMRGAFAFCAQAIVRARGSSLAKPSVSSRAMASAPG